MTSPRAHWRALLGLCTAIGLAQAAAATTLTYAYDPLGQLIAVNRDAQAVAGFSYDKAGNRTSSGVTPPVSSLSDTLSAGQELASGSRLRSSDGRFGLYMQTDGNLVLYTLSGDLPVSPIWSTGTSYAGARLVMQSDGHLVVYTPANQPLWASGTYGNPGARAVVQWDGNFVIYTPSNAPLWASGTGGR